MIMETPFAASEQRNSIPQISLQPRTMKLLQRVAQKQKCKSLEELIRALAVYIAHREGLLDGQLERKESPVAAGLENY